MKGSLKFSSWELKKQLALQVVVIFTPVFAVLIYAGYRQYVQTLDAVNLKAQKLISAFSKEQAEITSRTRQLLNVLSYVPSVNNFDYEQCNDLLKKVHQDNPQYSTIVVADGNGLINCCAVPLKETIDVSDRSWFKRIKSDRSFIVDNFLISRSAKKASLPFAYPLLDQKGEFVGALGAAVNLETYSTFFEKISFPEDTVIAITDRTGRLLYQSSSEEQCLGKTLEECRGFYLPLSRDGKKSIQVKDADGQDWIYWYDWLWVGNRDNEICLSVGISKQQVLKSIYKSVGTYIGLLAVIACASFLTLWALSQKFFLSPIDLLVKKTESIKKGIFQVPDKEQTLPAELAILSDAINEMAVDISKRESERDLALLKVNQELVEKQKVEAELREREERLAILFENAADAIYVCNLDGYLTQFNKAACKATGYNEQEIANCTLVDLDSNLSSLDEFREFANSLVAGQQVILLSAHTRKDGTTFPVEITIVQIDTHDGPRVMGIARDISERLEIEDRMKQGQKMEAVGRLAGGVAHDLNNLLTPILGYSEMLTLDPTASGSFKEKIQHIFKAGEAARDLVKQLLAFSRKQILEYQPLDVNMVLEGFEPLIRRTLRENIPIKITLSESLSQISADQGQLEQIIMNLSVNAADSMPDGGELFIQTAMVELDASYVSEHLGATEGTYVMLSFSDTGAGMDMETQAKIFEPFYTTKGEKGTGLGLATVYGIVKQHGGTIWVYSEEGKGTTFKLYFPAVKDSEVVENIERPVPLVELKGSERILLVEDNELVRNTVSDILEEHGYNVVSIGNASEVMDEILSDKEEIKLLLTDVVMPDMNGKELFTLLLEIYPSLKVLYMSGYTDDIIVHHGVLDYGVDFIHKPFTRKSILTKVREVLCTTQPG